VAFCLSQQQTATRAMAKKLDLGDLAKEAATDERRLRTLSAGYW